MEYLLSCRYIQGEALAKEHSRDLMRRAADPLQRQDVSTSTAIGRDHCGLSQSGEKLQSTKLASGQKVWKLECRTARVELEQMGTIQAVYCAPCVVPISRESFTRDRLI